MYGHKISSTDYTVLWTTPILFILSICFQTYFSKAADIYYGYGENLINWNYSNIVKYVYMLCMKYPIHLLIDHSKWNQCVLYWCSRIEMKTATALSILYFIYIFEQPICIISLFFFNRSFPVKIIFRLFIASCTICMEMSLVFVGNLRIAFHFNST